MARQRRKKKELTPREKQRNAMRSMSTEELHDVWRAHAEMHRIMEAGRGPIDDHFDCPIEGRYRLNDRIEALGWQRFVTKIDNDIEVKGSFEWQQRDAERKLAGIRGRAMDDELLALCESVRAGHCEMLRRREKIEALDAEIKSLIPRVRECEVEWLIYCADERDESFAFGLPCANSSGASWLLSREVMLDHEFSGWAFSEAHKRRSKRDQLKRDQKPPEIAA